MAATKPQIHTFFPTPVCVHYLPIATEANAELRPLILEKAGDPGPAAHGQGWRSDHEFESWGGAHVQTLFRVLRDLADGLTATRAGARINLEWKVSVVAAVRHPGEYQEPVARPVLEPEEPEPEAERERRPELGSGPQPAGALA